MRTADGPLISVIVCTCDRPQLLPRALASVLRQEGPDFEVIVVDDGSTPPAELPKPAGDRARLVRIEHGGVGAARAAGLRAARGEYVAYCDDDDEWLPGHLGRLLAYLRESPDVDLVYADSEWLQPGAPPGLPYSFDHEGTLLREMNYIFPTDVLHRARAARAVGGFDSSLQAYEDWDLWLRMHRTFTFRHLPVVLARHHWHEDCVTAANPWQVWDRVYWYARDALPTASVADRHDLVSEAAKARPFDRSTWRDGRRELIWRSVMRAGEGYGTVGRRLLRALEGLGVDITMAPSRDQPVRGFERFYKPLDHWGRLAFYCDYRLRPGVLPCERVVSHSMWESTLVPREHVAEVNRAAALQYVPCRQNADAFRDCGLRVPVKVLHYGVDPEEFPYVERPRREVFTFGSFGDFSPRKGIDVLVRAFEQEFAPGEPVRLVLKTAGKAPDYAIRDERVVLRSGYLDRQQLLEFLRGLDAFVLPSRGEGFGLCGLEAMATGLPLIATNWSGPAEYLDAQDCYPLDYRLVDVQSTEATRIRYFGQWAEPDVGHLRHLLRWLYEHPREAAEKGRRAAARVRERWTWERVGRQVLQDLDELASL